MDNKILSCFGVLFFALVLLVVSSIVSGLTLQQLWIWFIVPTFELPILSLPASIGLMVVGDMFILGLQKSDPYDKNKTVAEVVSTGITHAIAPALMVLGWGWVIHLFM